MYSGYIDVGENLTHHIHYVFVESTNDPSNDPVVLWVQGGPGGSSLEGMLVENMSPFQLNDASLLAQPPQLFPSSAPWTSVANMLFWEAPSGVGFSYCDGGCPLWNDTTSSAEHADFICRWFEAFPEFAGNPFYMVGESYAGVYIPTTALELLTANLCAATTGEAPLVSPRAGSPRGYERLGLARPLDFRGVAVGNGCTGTEAGPCSPERAKYTFGQLAAQGLVSGFTADLVREECAATPGFVDAEKPCQAAVLEASDEAGPFDPYNVHDVCGPPDAGSTLAAFVCGETPGADWACAHAGLGGAGAQARVRARAAAFEGPRGALYAGRLVSEKEKAGSNVVAPRLQGAPPAVKAQRPFEGFGGGPWTAGTFMCDSKGALQRWLSDPAVMSALHVEAAGPGFEWPGDRIEYTRSAPNLAESPGYPDLIAAGLRLLIFSGTFDGQVPSWGTEKWTRGMGTHLGFTAKPTRPWLRDGQVSGHVTTYDLGSYNKSGDFSGEFSYLTIARAGHMAPQYQPHSSLSVLKKFLSGGGAY